MQRALLNSLFTCFSHRVDTNYVILVKHQLYPSELTEYLISITSGNVEISIEKQSLLLGSGFPSLSQALTKRMSEEQKHAAKGMYSTALAETYKFRDQSSSSKGNSTLFDNRVYKGMSFTIEERQVLGIHGLLPPAVKTQAEQEVHVMSNINSIQDSLGKYIYLNALQDRDEKLFYRVLYNNVFKLMPIVYTPTVGEACKKFGAIFQRPKGVYISIHDRKLDQIDDILRNWPVKDVRAIVMTDGERILGLGDLGTHGMGIPIGKLALYVALAGVQPHWCLPITLDVGTDNEENLKDPFYTGLRQKRNRGPEYDELIENVFKAVVRRYGQECLVQFEDFANHNAFRLLKSFRDRYCTFNDDIQGTASCALAGLLAAIKLKKEGLKDNVILFYGAGEASLGIAQFVVLRMQMEGLSEAEAKKRVWMVDSKGLIVKGRAIMTPMKEEFAQEYREIKSLEEIVEAVKPTALIGASAVFGAFTEKTVKLMAAQNELPLIFALSNPTSKAECTAEQAYTWTEGKTLFASGSPFDPVTVGGKTHKPGQANNAYIFPGAALGIILFKLRHVPDQVFVVAAEVLANWVRDSDLEGGTLYPPLQQCHEISVSIALKIGEYAYKEGIAALYPEPNDKEAFIRAQLYDTSYSSLIPQLYSWPSL